MSDPIQTKAEIATGTGISSSVVANLDILQAAGDFAVMILALISSGLAVYYWILKIRAEKEK